jgi:hypothetical protein
VRIPREKRLRRERFQGESGSEKTPLWRELLCGEKVFVERKKAFAERTSLRREERRGENSFVW